MHTKCLLHKEDWEYSMRPPKKTNSYVASISTFSSIKCLISKPRTDRSCFPTSWFMIYSYFSRYRPPSTAIPPGAKHKQIASYSIAHLAFLACNPSIQPSRYSCKAFQLEKGAFRTKYQWNLFKYSFNNCAMHCIIAYIAAINSKR